MSPCSYLAAFRLASAGTGSYPASYLARDGYSGYTQVSPDHGAPGHLEPSTASATANAAGFLICPLDLARQRARSCASSSVMNDALGTRVPKPHRCLHRALSVLRAIDESAAPGRSSHVRRATHRTARCRPQTALRLSARRSSSTRERRPGGRRGVDLAFDVIGGDIEKRSAGLIRAGGTVVSVVGTAGADSFSFAGGWRVQGAARAGRTFRKCCRAAAGTRIGGGRRACHEWRTQPGQAARPRRKVADQRYSRLR